jgi:hypothetical protein
MRAGRGSIAAVAMLVLAWSAAFGAAWAENRRPEPDEVLRKWYGLVLELVRHTPTYSPPVASRTFAYLGVTAFEAVAGGSAEMVSLAGQLHGLGTVPARTAGQTYDDAVVLDAALAEAVGALFANTGPTGQRALRAAERKWRAAASAGLPSDVVERSEGYGQAVASHVLHWSREDGGARIANMGFPLDHQLTAGPANWVPTSSVAQQQLPLLPRWGSNRPFAMPGGDACPVPAPVEFSEDDSSRFYREALEVYDATRNLTPDQRAIARFWSDDPMLSPTPPGHWISLVLQVAEQQDLPLDDTVDVLARVGIAVADAFISCWHEKYRYDLVRPVTYVRRLIDTKWEPLLITPPFPEYPSGHSTQSAAAATVLTAFFGNDFGFEDRTGERDGLAPRSFTSFWMAAEEAGMSRLYGGIHFRAAIEAGLVQGRCVGAHVAALRTRR